MYNVVDLLIRNVDVMSVAKIEALAKQMNVSRQTFLKSLIERYANYDVFQNDYQEVEQLLMSANKKIDSYLKQQEVILQKIHTLEVLLQKIDEGVDYHAIHR